jgi:hypothetical protein
MAPLSPSFGSNDEELAELLRWIDTLEVHRFNCAAVG